MCCAWPVYSVAGAEPCAVILQGCCLPPTTSKCVDYAVLCRPLAREPCVWLPQVICPPGVSEEQLAEELEYFNIPADGGRSQVFIWGRGTPDWLLLSESVEFFCGPFRQRYF